MAPRPRVGTVREVTVIQTHLRGVGVLQVAAIEGLGAVPAEVLGELREALARREVLVGWVCVVNVRAGVAGEVQQVLVLVAGGGGETAGGEVQVGFARCTQVQAFGRIAAGVLGAAGEQLGGVEG